MNNSEIGTPEPTDDRIETRQAQKELMEYSGLVEIMLLYYRVVRIYYDSIYLLSPGKYDVPCDYRLARRQAKRFMRYPKYIKSGDHQDQMIMDKRLMTLEWIVARLANLLEPHTEKPHQRPSTSIRSAIHMIDTPKGSELMARIPGSQPDWKERIEKSIETFDDEYRKMVALRNKLEHQHLGLYAAGTTTQWGIDSLDWGELYDMLNLIDWIILEFEILCLGEDQVIMRARHDVYWKRWVQGMLHGGTRWFTEGNFDFIQTEATGIALRTSSPHMDVWSLERLKNSKATSR